MMKVKRSRKRKLKDLLEQKKKKNPDTPSLYKEDLGCEGVKNFSDIGKPKSIPPFQITKQEKKRREERLVRNQSPTLSLNVLSHT